MNNLYQGVNKKFIEIIRRDDENVEFKCHIVRNFTLSTVLIFGIILFIPIIAIAMPIYLNINGDMDGKVFIVILVSLIFSITAAWNFFSKTVIFKSDGDKIGFLNKKIEQDEWDGFIIKRPEGEYTSNPQDGMNTYYPIFVRINGIDHKSGLFIDYNVQTPEIINQINMLLDEVGQVAKFGDSSESEWS